MQLPEHLQHFHHPTLIVTADFRRAVCYLADGQEISELQTLKAPEPAHPDADSSVSIGGHRYANLDAGVDEGSDRLHYGKDLSHLISELAASHNAKDIQLVMPAELLRRTHEELSDNVRDLVSKTLDKDLMKMDLLAVLERLRAIPTPVSL